MAIISVSVPVPITATIAEELAKEAAFVSRDILGISCGADNARLDVDLSDEADLASVTDKLERFIGAFFKGYRATEDKVIYRRERSAPAQTDFVNAFAQMSERGWAREVGPGSVLLAGPAMRLYRYLDVAIGDRYVSRFAAKDLLVPSLMHTDELCRCGYFDSHANNTTFVTHLPEDIDAIEDFRHANVAEGPTSFPTPLPKPAAALNPAACYPLYQYLSGCVVGAPGKAYSWQGRVFRFESRNLQEMQRLWEFGVRELVFVGTAEYVAAGRDGAIVLLREIAEEFDIALHFQVATDPFFVTVAAARRLWQQSMESKYEVRASIADGKSLAIGSVNAHGTFFSLRFGIVAEGAPAHTACVGLGLERLVYALFQQHGFEGRCWPRQFIEAGVFEGDSDEA
jgi:seryl-tRNA synthetase